MVSLQRIQTLQPMRVLFGARQSVDPGKYKVPDALLAVNVDFSKLQYPVLISPKIDGNRGLILNAQVMGRSTDVIPNPKVQEILGHPELNGLDGELVAGSITADDACAKTTGYMAQINPTHSQFSFQAFDLWDMPDKPFTARLAELKKRVTTLLEGLAQKRLPKFLAKTNLPRNLGDFLKIVPQILVHNQQEILKYEEKWLKQGYEGLIIRNPNALYVVPNKENRATMADQALLKLKKFEDSEAVIEGFRPLDPKSRFVQSLVKSGEITAADVKRMQAGEQALSGYKVKDISVGTKTSGMEFDLGAGSLTFAERLTMWKKQKTLLGKILKYKHFPKGVKKKPRHPGFLGFRADHDLPANLKKIVDQQAKKTANTAPADDE